MVGKNIPKSKIKNNKIHWSKKYNNNENTIIMIKKFTFSKIILCQENVYQITTEGEKNKIKRHLASFKE